MKLDDARRSITATLDEIARTQQALGIPAEPDELYEVREIVARIEEKLAKRKQKAPQQETAP